MRSALASRMTTVFALFVLCGGSCCASQSAHASSAASAKDEIGIWAVCPHISRGYYSGVYSNNPEYVRPPGLYVLRGTKMDGVVDIREYEVRRFFSEFQLGYWIGHTSGSRYLVLYGEWELGSGIGYTVFDKNNPIDMKFVAPETSSDHRFGWIDSRWQVTSLGMMPEGGWHLGAPRPVLVFDPETLTISRPGQEAWRHRSPRALDPETFMINRPAQEAWQHRFPGEKDLLTVRDGRLVYQPLFDLPFEGDIPENLMVEGKTFVIHWNDSRRTVLTTTMVGETSGIIMMIIDKGTRETITKEYEPMPAAFRVHWPWAIWAATGLGRAPSEHELLFMVRDWHVEHLENGQLGEFALEVRSDIRGIDILDDVIFWGIGRVLWSVDLREAVEKGSTTPHRVWEDPLVPAIQALFYAQDDDEPESSEKPGADTASQGQEIQDRSED